MVSKFKKCVNELKKEIKNIVWPTKNETKTQLFIVCVGVVLLIIFIVLGDALGDAIVSKILELRKAGR